MKHTTKLFQKNVLILFIIMMLLMSWDGIKNDTALASGPIPEQSIRLRVLANSDAPADQQLKREVRDVIIAEMKNYVGDIQDVQQAREVIHSRLAEISTTVQKTVNERGYTYTTKVELGKVPFPTKMYGSFVYPAGDYEALRVTIGAGAGQNWWCVLFPPLCFVDMQNGDAVSPDEGKVPGEAGVEKQDGQTGTVEKQVKVKFFFIEWLSGLFS